MKIGRFINQEGPPRVGVLTGPDTLLDLVPAGITQLHQVLEADDLPARLHQLIRPDLPALDPSQMRWCAPADAQEVWAAGVTYLRSKTARMEESQFSASAYDRVYEAARPELFFKALPEKVVGLDQAVGIRKDSRWNVPEPELALVLNSKGKLVGYTIGNDMSSRDIEGENLLYLPQAKTYHCSCALGPWITVGVSEAEARTWTISMRIQRGGSVVFSGQTAVSQIKRSFDELADFLFRSQVFPQGAIMLTGTGIIPPDDFTLQERDEVTIEISGIGSLRNPVKVV
jgi:2-dehydro-3-deoxy-D-arabinonate dehydratase